MSLPHKGSGSVDGADKKDTLAVLLFTPAFSDTAYYASPRGWQSAVESFSMGTDGDGKYEIVKWLYRAVESASAISLAALKDPKRVNSELDLLFRPVREYGSVRLINDTATMMVLDRVVHALSPSVPVQGPVTFVGEPIYPESSSGFGAYEEQVNLVEGNNWVRLLSKVTNAMLDAKERDSVTELNVSQEDDSVTGSLAAAWARFKTDSHLNTIGMNIVAAALALRALVAVSSSLMLYIRMLIHL